MTGLVTAVLAAWLALLGAITWALLHPNPGSDEERSFTQTRRPNPRQITDPDHPIPISEPGPPPDPALQPPDETDGTNNPGP